jgi:photosystem II stability/assembly factor-like uncharacterized protein
MRLSKRLPWLLMLLSLFVSASSCNRANQNGNQTGSNTTPLPARQGHWVEQWRSPATKGAEGAALIRFSLYTCLSVVSSSVVFAGGDIPGPKGAGERVGVFVKTIDGGKTWTETTLDRPDMLITTINAIHFINPTTGWLAGVTSKMEGVVLRTTDAGVNWEATLVTIVKQVPTTIYFIDENRGWMGGTFPVGEDDDEEEMEGKPTDLLFTSDGGKTWVAQRRLPITVLDISFIDNNTGWLTGYKGAIYKTTDGGLSWNQQRSELELGEGSSLAIVGEGSKKFKIYGVHFSDADNGFAVAISGDTKEGRVLGTTNGGDSWAKKLIGGDEGFRDVFSLTALEAWVVTNYGRYIYHTVDGGRYWSSEPVTFDQDVPFFDIQGADPAHVWAAGGGGIFTRLMD